MTRGCKGVVIPVSTGNHFYILSWEFNADAIHVRDSMAMVGDGISMESGR
jgi:hypothetical protein